MAATFGTFGPSLGLNESSTTFKPLTNVAHDTDTLSPPSIRRNPPLPIPNFAFPPRPSQPDASPQLESHQHPATSSSNLAQLHLAARNHGRSQRPAALPVFSFNPGASLSPSLHSPTLLSPPASPHSPNHSPTRTPRHGHRRGGSEFVGGSIRDGSSIAVMSSSPTKDGGFSSQSLQLPRRRGHGRGLSGAISVNDLSTAQPTPIMSTPKGNSAPNSPTNFDRGIHATIPLLDDPPHVAALPEPVQKPAVYAYTTHKAQVSPQSSPKPVRTAAKARVDFSDKLEYIPRPLSLVSSDTSSTVTARPAQCVSESTSSLVPLSCNDNTPAIVPRSPIREKDDSRPSTAGAILEAVSSADATFASPRRRNSIPTLIDAPESMTGSPVLSSPIKSSKRWSFFGLEPFSPSSCAARSRPISSSGSDDSGSRAHTLSSSDRGSDSEATDHAKSKLKSKKEKNRKSRTETVKGWLPLKPKSDKRRSKIKHVRPPTPPPSVTPLDEDDENAKDATSGRNVAPALIDPNRPVAFTAATQKLRRSEEVMSPMIDLDAALGPFNTPPSFNPEWEAAQRAASIAGRRRLHSAKGFNGFSGPGMHYHRRAESAPNLPPFDSGRVVHRFGSNSTMADVFEEDEEAESSDGSNAASALHAGMKFGLKTESSVIANDSGSETTSLQGLAVRRKSSGLRDQGQSGTRVRAQCSKNSLHESVMADKASHSTGMLHSPTMTVSHQSSFDSTASSPKRNLVKQNNESLPVDAVPLTLAQGALMPLSPHSMSTASPYPSPRSPMSVDAQRVSTAASSVTEDKSFQSLLMGEPGPELRISVDYDIPSLTSSATTMTRESVLHQARPYPNSLREQRPSSVSSAAFGRRRSSLISLTRLINSSHGERSKLSTELTFEEAETKAMRKSKTKKLSRMMQFWKPSKNAPTI